ncbi:MAG: glycoside hydrolase [Clostridia bacterium]|nr:glycoside hydrolase [Clostridia bacterium]MDE7329172.1 glycoside hydrolase [Clostridia bacterium]
MDKSKKIKIAVITIVSVLLIALCVIHGVLSVTSVDIKEFLECSINDINKKYKQVVDKRFNTYLGHPDLVEIDGALMTFYPSGHGKGAIIGKISDDLGETWRDMENLPSSWENSMETPCVYKLNMTDGREVLVLTSGCPYWSDIKALPNGFNCSVSFDKGVTWSEFDNWYGQEWAQEKYSDTNKAYDCVVAMSSLTQLKDANGNFINKWMGTFHRGTNDYGMNAGEDYINYCSFLTFVENDGQLKAVWSEPVPMLSQYRELEDKYGMCELEIIRNDKDNCLILLARANRRVSNSIICYSYDEGATWSEPKELPNCLSGDRHKAEYDPVSGKLIISFRQLLQNGTAYKPHAFSSVNYLSKGWVVWIGEVEDLMSYADDDKSNDTYGDGVYIIARNYGGADCGYSGVECLDDGTVVMVSYGYFTCGALKPYILQAKFTVADIIE